MRLDGRKEEGVANVPNDSLMAVRNYSHGSRLSDVTFLLLVLNLNWKPLESTATISLRVLAIGSTERLCSRLISVESRLRMSQQPIPFRRSLLSLSLPKDISAALTRNGYETVADISSVTPEELSTSKQRNQYLKALRSNELGSAQHAAGNDSRPLFQYPEATGPYSRPSYDSPCFKHGSK